MNTRVAKYDLKNLVRFIESRHVAIPEFQRGYVWKTAQVKKLFDSLIKQYPVGSFIIWETNKNIDARSLDGEKLSKRKFLILDGQQRMVSIYYLCRQKLFVEPHVKDKFHETVDSRERNVIEFEKFYIDKNEKGQVLEYSRDSSCKFDFKKFQRLIQNGYKFPVITITLDDYRKAIEVFERINQAGTTISTESIFLSETWNTHSNIGKILRTWKKNNKSALTSRIDTVIFIHVFAIILQLEQKKKNEKIDIGIQTLKKIADLVRNTAGEKYNHIFEKVVGSVARAVQHLTDQYKIVNLGELPSQTMITVLSVFFYYKQSPSILQLKELRKWFWRSSLANRYIGSGYSQNVDVDAKKMSNLANKNLRIDIPLSSSKIFAKLLGVNLRTGRSTYRNIIKQALWQQKPVFIDDTPVSRTDVESGQRKPEDDHFFPFDLSRKGVSGQEINNILNIHFIGKRENIQKSNEWPSVWLEKRIKEIGAGKNLIQKYFESELLPFDNLKDLKRYEKASMLKGPARQRFFAPRYKSFLWKRFKLFEKALLRLQNGNDK